MSASSESEFESGDTEVGSRSIPGNNATLSASVLISILLYQLPILMLLVGYRLQIPSYQSSVECFPSIPKGMSVQRAFSTVSFEVGIGIIHKL